jgi:D-lactate dehydrogenase
MGNPISIAFFDTKPYDRESFDAANRSRGFDLRYFEGKLSPKTVAVAEGCRVVCAFVNDDLSAETLRALRERGVELVALRCAGYNNVDLAVAFKLLTIVRVPAYSPNAVAEHAVALALTLNRKTHKAYNRTRDGNFSIVGLTGFDMVGKTVGVVGTGRIGKAAAKIFRGFGMEVLLYDLMPDKAFAAELGGRYVGLDEIYASSDIVTLHCPLSKETRHLIGNESLAKMKRGVMLINTSRGALVDAGALIEALKTGQVGSAGLDVYEEESEYFFEDRSNQVVSDDVLARLLSFNNVLVTSHQAFLTKEALQSIAETTLGNVADFVDGKALPNQICYRCGLNPATCPKAKSGRCF